MKLLLLGSLQLLLLRAGPASAHRARPRRGKGKKSKASSKAAKCKSGKVECHSWTDVRPTAPFDPTTWKPRAGLRALELHGDLYAMGGRGPFSTTATTPIYGDVWKSADGGAAWSKLVEWNAGDTGSMWRPRSYFGAVTLKDRLYIMAGQNFNTKPNPNHPDGCGLLPPGAPCLPIVPDSDFFSDVWSSDDGAHWVLHTPSAPWAGRAGLSALEHDGELYVLAGSQGDDVASGGSQRVFFDDVWKSRDGVDWEEMVTSRPKWEPRAGAAVVSKGGYLYLLGGEIGFTCGFNPSSPCQPATDTLYFNDVWRSRDGADWERVTDDAGWSPRPGHVRLVVKDEIVCFGGYGEVPGNPIIPANPTDVWTSRDGATWKQLGAPASPPWNSNDSADMKYDFAALALEGDEGTTMITFGGDRERFGLPNEANEFLLDNDVWTFALG